MTRSLDRIPEQLEEWMANYPRGEQLNFVFEPGGGKASKETALSELRRIMTEKSSIYFQEFVPGKWYRFD